MKRKRTGQAAAKRRQGLINEAERKRNKVTRIGRSISGPRVREALTVGGLVAGVPLAWHGARGMVDKREAPSRGDVDAAAAGALAGGLGYQGAMYATKPVDAALRRKVDKDPKAKARLNRHARKMKIDSTDPGAMDRYKQFNRTYPKSVPGWQWRRAMSHLHGGKTGVGLTLASAGAGAAGGVAWKRRHDSGVAKGLLQPPKFNYARSIGAGLRARKPRAGGVRLTPTGRQVTFRGSVR
jgi:hypothetical protein